MNQTYCPHSTNIKNVPSIIKIFSVVSTQGNDKDFDLVISVLVLQGAEITGRVLFNCKIDYGLDSRYRMHGVRAGLKGLIYKNLQNPAEGGTAPRPMIHTLVICCP